MYPLSIEHPFGLWLDCLEVKTSKKAVEKLRQESLKSTYLLFGQRIKLLLYRSSYPSEVVQSSACCPVVDSSRP